MTGPERLLSDPAQSEALRADLAELVEHRIQFDAGAGLARFEAAIGVGTGSAGSALGTKGTTAAGVSSTASGLKLAALVTLGLGGLGLGAALLMPAGAPDPQPQAVTAAPAAAPVEAPRQAGAEPEQVPTPEAATPEAAPAPVESAPPRARKPSAPTAPAAPAVPEEAPLQQHKLGLASTEPVPDTNASDAETTDDLAVKAQNDLLEREIKHLAQVNQAVGRAPAYALRLADQGHVDFRQGVLYEEREALALVALQRLGRTAELRARGEAFLRSYRLSPFRARVQSLLRSAY